MKNGVRSPTRSSAAIMQLDWSTADDIPVLSANLVLAQGSGEEVFLWFGRATPPATSAVLQGEQLAEYTRNTSVPVQPIARLVVPVSVAKNLMQVLQANLDANASSPEAEEGDE